MHRALKWDAEDRRDRRWWPQGISTSADASDTEDVEGRRMLVVSWYAKDLPGEPGSRQGSRLTFLDLATRRYRHVLLVNPVVRDGVLALEPLQVHAGGVVWCGPYLHVAATARGVITCRLDDLLRVPDAAARRRGRLGLEDDRVSSYGYRYVLPVRFAYRAMTDDGLERLRYSFLSLDRSGTPPELVVGEYGNSAQTRRLARFPLDPETLFLAEGEDGVSRPLVVDDGGVVRTQGAAIAHGRWYLTALDRPVGPRLGVRRPARLVPALPLGHADGPRGHRLVALDRPALVGHRAPAPPLDLLDEALAVLELIPGRLRSDERNRRGGG